MKFVLPVEGMDAQQLYAHNQNGHGGFFPIGCSRMYHGGIHIEGNHNVVAISDGNMIAYRYSKEYCSEERKGKKYPYSNCFVLIRHEYTTPNGQPIVFFSHYSHLRPWDNFTEEQKKRLPAPFSKSGFRITADGLRARSAPDKTKDNVISTVTLANGSEIVASPINETWAKKEGEEVYFAYKGFTDPIKIQSDQLRFDAVTTCEIPVKAGDLLGYTGMFLNPEAPDDLHTVHVEVFAGDDTVDFVNNKKHDGEKKPVVFQVASGATLKKREKKYPDLSKLTKYSLAANTLVGVVENDAEKKWCKIKEIALVNTLKREWVDRHTAVPADIHYTSKADTLADVRSALGNNGITTSSKIYLLKELKGSDRLVKYTLPAGSGKTCWVKADVLEKGGSTYYLKSATEGYSDNPDSVVFTTDAVKLKEELNENISNTESAKDEKGKVWHKVGSGANEGWIADDDGKLKKQSVFDWPKFKIAKEKGSAADDTMIDFKMLSPFFKTVIDEINTDKDNKISDKELKAAMKNPELAEKLSHLICYHQSEWYLDDGLTSWQKVLKKVGLYNAKKLEDQLKTVCWWREVADNSKLFLKSPDVYHWHPVAFIEQMKKMDGSCLFPLPSEYRDKGYHSGMRAFGSDRSKKTRRHAGCDLYAPLGTNIHAVADGTIIGYYNYYWKTFALAIDHGDFSVLYGEVQPPADPENYGYASIPYLSTLTANEKRGLPAGLKKGSTVKRGQHIAYVGQLYENSGTVKHENTMLHFEKFSNEAEGAFTNTNNVNDYWNIKDKSPSKPFYRREDLENPTEFLDECE